MNIPVLSIIVTSRNRHRVLMRCVKSIICSEFRDFELIVIDDASSDGTERLTDSDLQHPQARIIHIKEQIMMVKARNLGVSYAKGRYLLIIDDDNVVPLDMSKKLIAAMEDYSQYGVLGPVMYYYSTQSLKMCGQKINLFTGRTRELVNVNNSHIIDSDGIPNAFMIRKSVFDEVNGFDASIVQTFTEPDFAYQARMKGYKCGVVASAKIYHDIPVEGQLTPRSLGTTYIQKAYCLMRNRTVIVARYGSFVQKLVYFLFFSWFWPLVYSLIMLRWRQTEVLPFYWRGFVDGLRYMLTGRLSSSLPSLLKRHLKEG